MERSNDVRARARERGAPWLPWAVLVVIASLGGLGRAAAQSEPWRGPRIVRIEGEDVLVDVGTPAAVNGGQLDVYRVLEVRHPITRQVLRDRFLVGRLTVVQAGEVLSVTRIAGAPWRALVVGDEIGARVAAREGPTTIATRTAPSAEPRACPPTTCPRCEGPPPDFDSANVLRVWTATLGQPPEARVQLYRRFLATNPASRYAAYLRAEIAALEATAREQAQRAATAPRATPPPSTPEGDRPTTPGIASLRHEPLGPAITGDPLEVAGVFVGESGALPRAVLLYVRAKGTAEFTARRMQLDSRGYVRARVPRRFVAPPGFDYFVEGVGTDGQSVPLVRHVHAPVSVAVTPPPAAPDPSVHRSRVRFSAEAISFDGVSGDDAFVVTEGDFLYRTLFGAFYGVRVGYGVILGQGGTVQELDVMGLAPHPAGYTYGFAEVELRLTEIFGVVGRTEIGLGRPADEADERDGLVGGFQLRLRVGKERGTHLLIAGETLPEVGQRAFLGLHWEVIERFPMQAEVHVTDQPVNSDELAVRLVYELGWRASEVLVLSARLSYQGRTVDHAGPGAGLAMTFDW